MADIELVIKIPEEMYKTVQDGTYCGTLYEELKNGTPLPKGHGRLIDADVYEWDNRNIIDCEIDHPKYQVSLKELIDDAPTIIEAEE